MVYFLTLVKSGGQNHTLKVFCFCEFYSRVNKGAKSQFLAYLGPSKYTPVFEHGINTLLHNMLLKWCGWAYSTIPV